MLRFKAYIAEATMTVSGFIGQRHAQKYVEPNKGKTLKLASKHADIPAGEHVTIHGHEVVNGKFHAIASASGEDKQHHIPFSKLLKPATDKENKGLSYENEFVQHLNKHGVMGGGGAGFTGGNDFHLAKKNGQAIQGEAKQSTKTAAFGQATLSHTPEKGWHFGEKAKKRFPEYTKHAEKATITGSDGKKKNLLDHINDTFGPPNRNERNSTNLHSDTTTLQPMHAYLRDHHVDVLHVGSHGTYRAGLSQREDRHKLGLKAAEGTGKFRVRQKHAGSLTIQFNVKHMEPAGHDIQKEDDLNKIKTKLGHHD
jgi:hypothetical protein